VHDSFNSPRSNARRHLNTCSHSRRALAPPRPHSHQAPTSTARSAASPGSIANAEHDVLHLPESYTDVQAGRSSAARGNPRTLTMGDHSAPFVGLSVLR
jgi:hypothetical protein